MIDEIIDISACKFKVCVIDTRNVLSCWLQKKDINTYNPAEPLLFKSVSNGNRTVCAVSIDNHVHCYAQHNSDKLSDPLEIELNVPKKIRDGEYSYVSSGSDNVCAISNDSNRTLTCWT